MLSERYATEKEIEVTNNGITVFLADGKAWRFSKILKMNFIEYILSAINKLDTIE